MSLAHAILGFIHRQPMTGYDLKTQCFDKAVSNFWPADQAQIYRTLEKLESENWLRSTIEVQSERPNRKLYFITDEGHAELVRWLNEEIPLPIHREPFLVQLYFSEASDNREIMRLLEHQKEQHEARLRKYSEVRFPNSTNHVHRYLSFTAMPLSLGIRFEQAYIQWIEETMDVVRELPDVDNHDVNNGGETGRT